MRRTVLVMSLLLSGCSGSGFWRYQEDTLTLPWQNPNTPTGSSENFQRAKRSEEHTSELQSPYHISYAVL
jgi:hypothetical protein